MLAKSTEITEEQRISWLKRRADDKDLFDVFAEGFDSLINVSFESLKEKELEPINEDNDWN